MKSQKRGKNISEADIQSISAFGIWMFIQSREYFMSFENFPWFKKATVEDIYNFEFLHGRHLYWPALDIDLSLESIGTPEKFPLKAKSLKSGK